MCKLFSRELKKIFIDRKGILILILFLIVTFLSSFNSQNNIDLNLEREKSIFYDYEQKLSGKWNDEKEQYIENEGKTLSETSILINDLTYSLKKGEISSEEFTEQIAYLDELSLRADGFNVVYNKYLYVSQDTENRYFLYDNGWNFLLTGVNLQIFVILSLIILLTPLFCYEYESEISDLLITTKLGRERLFFSKVILGVIIAASFTLLSCFTEYTAALVNYGLPHGDYPIQSLSYYSTSIHNISLNQTFLFLVLSRVLGSIFICCLIIIFSIITKKTNAVLALISSILFLPILMPISESIKSKLPLPYAFLSGTGFLRGDIFSSEPNQIALNIKDFSALTKTQIYMFFAILIAFLILCLSFSLCKYLNKRYIKIRK